VTPEALLFSLRFVLFEVVRSREASGLPALVGLDSAEAADAYVLYSARKGGFINDLCSDGLLPSQAAQAGRIEETTMMRYYRRHELMDDALERNGVFGEVRDRVVLAEARRLGVEASPIRVRELAERHGLTVASAGNLSQDVLWARLEATVAGDVPRWAAAAAALLQASSINRRLTGALGAQEPVGCPSGEDDALRTEDVLALVHREARRAAFDQLQALELGVSQRAEDGELALTLDADERPAAEDTRGGLERVLVSLPAAAQAVLLYDWRLRSRLEVAAIEGAQVASVEEALGCKWSKGRAVLLWRQGLRWLEAPLEELSSSVLRHMSKKASPMYARWRESHSRCTASKTPA
jgi:hypothetical protein